MAEKGSVHPISNKDLEQHLKKVDEHLGEIRRSPTDRVDLFEVVKGIGASEKMTSKEVSETLEAVRKGFSLYYEMYAELENRINQLANGINNDEKRLFLNTYSMFAASYFTESKLSKLVEEEPFPCKREAISFNFNLSKDDTLNMVLSWYYGLVNTGKRRNSFEKGSDLPRGSIDFFKYLKETALGKKETLNPKLVDLVKDAQFKVADEFDLQGFQVSDTEATKMPKIEFVKVTPNEVVGNANAKRKVIRYMDRLALYDPRAKNNPCMILGGLSWTNLWDGIPGTGKTTMMRMAMTRLAEICEVIGMKYKIHAIDQSVKSEFYGKTGQNAIAEFNSTRDPNFLHLTILDDLDLLTQGSRQETSGGADNDLRNVIMQFLDGAFTIRNGANQVYSASNDPKGLDPAVRNRHNDRLLVEGPKTVEDLSDMTFIQTKQLRESGLLLVEVGYTPFETQDNYVNGKWTRPDEIVYATDPEITKKFKKATIKDFGQYLFELKQKNPTISGRSVKAIIEAIKERSADFDVPPEFFTNRKIYIEQPFQKKVEILKELYKTIEPEVLFQEAKRYAESEARYSKGEEEREVDRGYNSRIWGMMAEIKALRGHPELYGEADALRTKLALELQQKKGIIDRIKAGGK